uniref:Glycolipid transfer protein domain-containing protein n=1 Tax=Timspurckia oligopyrenoides TaxID=708627 RepID=A0A7S1ET15_9RHOD|mmetsp:Transcript_5174/g.9025  ORF Transcript_5174/g.9025 Transcript_5174/m.9025 type:complete len:356 (+) Transcript_5174:342-1409(+)|eukprot:CAMPEP_0182445100 /NCGR_PEP_ID=MMETSP1172-20130603/3346_1 /TAXON_ID=708627 /ORGANISM="Timspurckia oligopyrenoides, Strain CCMP3278" /LENGTH=355 /DNA_ID=CAMNT_0024640807 /DNA_START=318 /DNA_END=1385 /DNA_ORIENTATION=-
MAAFVLFGIGIASFKLVDFYRSHVRIHSHRKDSKSNNSFFIQSSSSIHEQELNTQEPLYFPKSISELNGDDDNDDTAIYSPITRSTRNPSELDEECESEYSHSETSEQSLISQISDITHVSEFEGLQHSNLTFEGSLGNLIKEFLKVEQNSDGFIDIESFSNAVLSCNVIFESILTGAASFACDMIKKEFFNNTQLIKKSGAKFNVSTIEEMLSKENEVYGSRLQSGSGSEGLIWLNRGLLFNLHMISKVQSKLKLEENVYSKGSLRHCFGFAYDQTYKYCLGFILQRMFIASFGLVPDTCHQLLEQLELNELEIASETIQSLLNVSAHLVNQILVKCQNLQIESERVQLIESTR